MSNIVTLNIDNPLQDPTGQKMDVRAYSLILGLTFYKCKPQIIHDALEACEFTCTLQNVKTCIDRYKRALSRHLSHPVTGPVICNYIFQNAPESTIKVFITNKKSMDISHSYRLQDGQVAGKASKTVSYYVIDSGDRRQLVIDLDDDQLEVRVRAKRD